MNSPIVPRGTSKQHIVVLGLDGLLCNIQRRQPQHSEVSYWQLGLGCVVADYVVYLRPGLNEFLPFVFKNFHVIIWTSMERRRANAIAKFVLGSEFEPLRILSREHCTFISDLPDEVTDGSSCRGSAVAFKLLDEAIWQSPEYFQKIGFTPSRRNTVLVVDKPIVGLLNPPYSCIFLPHFITAIERPKFLNEVFMPWLKKWRQTESRLSQFLRDNPVGLPSITPSSDIARILFRFLRQDVRQHVKRFM